MNNYVVIGNTVREFPPGPVNQIISSIYKIIELSEKPGMEVIVRKELQFLKEYIEDAPVIKV